ncbi:inositol monophosphatase family protein [Cytophagaceae bacterium YF14B1]|uniref:Inositol monophosphatase family protein n=1 Tax=Xanthocytophaga flava TaxID=3048013 RepID=A0AAE3QT76_9BACT|nr:inositol monophosphatase family protein [Xanthocytophaga flavus]MDJ1485007.1 inositol monophosphatase family protein [Xanthocytophaga flavus]
MKTERNTMQEIDVPFILESIRHTGDTFLQTFKQNNIPQDQEELMSQFQEIDKKCLVMLQDALNLMYLEIPWAEDSEFDFEQQKQPLDLPEFWLCDSMDGAVQYMRHLPGWTINLVLVREGRPYLAVIYDPMQQEMYWAKEGEGAYLNGKPLQVKAKSELWLMLSVFEHPALSKSVTGLNHRIGASVEELLDQFGTVRNYGPHGLQLAWLGAGRIDVFCQEGLDTYNCLPGILIAKEAGAQISTTDGRDWTWGADSLFVAAPGVLERFLNKESNGMLSF